MGPKSLYPYIIVYTQAHLPTSRHRDETCHQIIKILFFELRSIFFCVHYFLKEIVNFILKIVYVPKSMVHNKLYNLPRVVV